MATIPASGSESSPTTGRRRPSRRTRARRSRTRNGRAIGRWRSSRPTRRCAGTGMRSISSTGPPPTTRAAGPCCSSGSATPNGRPVIPRTARPCSRPAASPTTSTRSTSSCARRLAEQPRVEQHHRGRSTTTASRCCERALARLGDADSPDRARLIWRCCASRQRGTPTSTSACRWRTRPSTWRDAPATTPRWSTRFGSATSRSRCPQTLELRRQWDAEACDLADDLGDPIARLHANLYRSLGRVGGGRPRHDATPGTPSSSRESERIGQPLNRWQIAYHRAWQPDARRRPRRRRAGRDRSPDRSARRPAIPDDATHGLRRPSSSPCAGCRAGCHEMVPLIEEVMRDNPGLRIFHATLACAKSLDDPHDEVRQFLDTEITNDFTVFDRRHVARRPGALGAGAVARSRPSTGGDGAVRTTVAVARPVRDDARHGPRRGRPLPRAARAHPRPPRRGRPVVRVRRSRSTKRWKRRSSSR